MDKSVLFFAMFSKWQKGPMAAKTSCRVAEACNLPTTDPSCLFEVKLVTLLEGSSFLGSEISVIKVKFCRLFYYSNGKLLRKSKHTELMSALMLWCFMLHTNCIADFGQSNLDMPSQSQAQVTFAKMWQLGLPPPPKKKELQISGHQKFQWPNEFVPSMTKNRFFEKGLLFFKVLFSNEAVGNLVKKKFGIFRTHLSTNIALKKISNKFFYRVHL